MSDTPMLDMLARVKRDPEWAAEEIVVSGRELDRLERELAAAQQQLGECSGGYQTLEKELAADRQRIAELMTICSKVNSEISQTLGKALHYPWLKDDQKNFPGSTEADGVCVGDHVAESLADEAASRIAELEREIEK